MLNLLDLIFPPFCASCSRIGSLLCQRCYEEIEFIPLPLQLALEPLYLDQVVAATYYQNPIQSVLHELKYKSVKSLGKWCGQLLFDSTDYPDADIVTFVPLHPRRQNHRGFNQAETMALEFARLARLPCSPLLRRTRHTQYQASISDRDQRLTHLRDCFEVNPESQFKLEMQMSSIPSPSVLIIDDVTTTGSTLNECAKVLKEYGFSRVFGLVVAHGN